MGIAKRDPKRGTWFFVLDVPSTDGRRRQVRRRGFKTRTEAENARAALVSDLSRGAFHRPSKVTVQDFLLNEWLPAKRSSLRPSTHMAYERTISNYIKPSIGQVLLVDVDGSMLTTLYGSLLTSGRVSRPGLTNTGLSPKTVRNVHGILRKAFADAVRWNRLLRNPCDAADPPRSASPEMRAWNTDEMRAFLAHAADHRWSAIWVLVCTTGMRRGEVLGLRWSDVDLNAATLTITSTRIRYGTQIDSSRPKTLRGNRTIALSGATVAALKTWRATQAADRLRAGSLWVDTSDLVVTLQDGSPPNPEAFSNLFKRLAAKAGLPTIRFHDLRHSYATAALAADVPVKVLSQRLGHADVAVTLKVYAHVLPGDDEEAARKADVALGLG